jgi:hypothetical protein
MMLCLFKFVPNQPKAAIFQVASFKMSHFEDPWTLPSPSYSMEGVRNLGMDMPLSTTKVAYNIVQQASTNHDLAPPQELDHALEPIWA